VLVKWQRAGDLSRDLDLLDHPPRAPDGALRSLDRLHLQAQSERLSDMESEVDEPDGARGAGDAVEAPAQGSDRLVTFPRTLLMTMRTTTSTSLLHGLRQSGNDAIWSEYVGRYRPLIVGFARRLDVPEPDAEDIAQVTLMEFAAAFTAGHYDRGRGRLRSWLFGIARNQVSSWRRRAPRMDLPLSRAFSGDPGVEESKSHDDLLEELWDREWRSAVLRDCLQQVRAEVEPQTYEAFCRFAIADRPAEEVATELGMTRNAVFLAKRRVLQRARQILPLMEEIW
jgi:RNA polymerase sigma-70 factor (ECF subfamily)